MVRTSESRYMFFQKRVCKCDEPGKPIFNGPGKADLCSECGKWLRRQLRICLQCAEQFMYIYQHPNMNFNTCWDCVQEFNLPYVHKPQLKIIPPESDCIYQSWSDWKPLLDEPSLD